MRISRIILLASCLALAGAASIPPARAPYVMHAGVLYRVNSGKDPQREPSQGIFTQRGQKYAVCLAAAKYHMDLLLLRGDSAGRYTVIKRARGAEIDASNAIMAVTVLDDDRVFVDLHINPSTGVGVELNTRTLKQDLYVGCGFTWDSSRRHLAYFDDGPHFSPRGACPGQVWVGHKRVKSLPGKVVTGVRWKNGGQLAVMLEGAGGAAGKSKTISLRP